MNDSKQIVTDFIKTILSTKQGQQVLLLNFSNPNILDINLNGVTELKHESEFNTVSGKKFDLVVGDLPFGMQTVAVDSVSHLKVNKNWSFVLTALRTLKEDGEAFFLIEPAILFSQQGRRFVSDLAAESFCYNSVFELPDKLLYPETAFQPIIIHFQRKEQDALFIAEITRDTQTLFNSFLSRASSSNLQTGILVDKETFQSFSKFRIENEIKNLQTQYKEYYKYQLKDIAIEINLTRDAFQDKPNSIYIPKVGISVVVADINSAKIKHQNLFQVVLKPEVVQAEFLALFFRSDLGRQILKSLTSGSFIPNINKSDIKNCFVSVPTLVEQNLLVLTNKKLSELQETIDELKAELSLNPKNANIILDKFESIQSPLKQLSTEDKILSLIRKGENKHIEFKETFSKNIKTGQKDKEIEKSSLKNIVGFLNADGGTLLIGISDAGDIKGVEEDFFSSPDKYKLNFKNAINSKIGPEFYPLVDYDLFSVAGHYILKVDCKAANKACFYDGTEFYVRTNPATDKLEGAKLIDYIKERFR